MTTMLLDVLPALPILSEMGYSESEVRQHSPKWVTDTITGWADRKKSDMAVSLGHTFVAVAAAMGSEEHHESLTEIMAKLGAVSESDEHLLNPEAQTDWSAFRNLEGVERVNKEAHPDA